MGKLGEEYPFETLPDLLAPGLKLAFVGLNPGLYSVRHGHYFARPTNRYWPALSRSRLSASIRAALGRAALQPSDDARLLEFGIGFTDVVKVPTRNAAELSSGLFREWAPRLLARMERYQPGTACFHGKMAFGAFLRYALNLEQQPFDLGQQPWSIGRTRLFVVPNPSPANAHFRLVDQTTWYDKLADYLTAC